MSGEQASDSCPSCGRSLESICNFPLIKITSFELGKMPSFVKGTLINNDLVLRSETSFWKRLGRKYQFVPEEAEKAFLEGKQNFVSNGFVYSPNSPNSDWGSFPVWDQRIVEDDFVAHHTYSQFRDIKQEVAENNELKALLKRYQSNVGSVMEREDFQKGVEFRIDDDFYSVSPILSNTQSSLCLCYNQDYIIDELGVFGVEGRLLDT